MMRKLSLWLVVAFAGCALLVGCGSSSTTTSTQTVGATSTPTGAASTPAGATTGPLRNAAACKQAINAQSTLSAAAKSKLEALCEKATTREGTALHKAAQEACVELVNASHVPAGATRERALAVCHTK